MYVNRVKLLSVLLNVRHVTFVLTARLIDRLGLVIDASNVVQLLVASERLGIAEVVKQCCGTIDSLPPDHVLQVIGAACDSGLTDIALLDSKVCILGLLQLCEVRI